jgi:hypothetical protein
VTAWIISIPMGWFDQKQNQLSFIDKGV